MAIRHRERSEAIRKVAARPAGPLQRDGALAMLRAMMAWGSWESAER